MAQPVSPLLVRRLRFISGLLVLSALVLVWITFAYNLYGFSMVY